MAPGPSRACAGEQRHSGTRGFGHVGERCWGRRSHVRWRRGGHERLARVGARRSAEQAGTRRVPGDGPCLDQASLEAGSWCRGGVGRWSRLWRSRRGGRRSLGSLALPFVLLAFALVLVGVGGRAVVRLCRGQSRARMGSRCSGGRGRRRARLRPADEQTAVHGVPRARNQKCNGTTTSTPTNYLIHPFVGDSC